MGVRAFGGVGAPALFVGDAVVRVGQVVGLGVGLPAQADPGEVMGPVSAAMDGRFGHHLSHFVGGLRSVHQENAAKRRGGRARAAISQTGPPSASAHRTATAIKNKAICRLELLNPLIATPPSSVNGPFRSLGRRPGRGAKRRTFRRPICQDCARPLFGGGQDRREPGSCWD